MALVAHEGNLKSFCQCGGVSPLCAYCIWGKLGPKWQAELRDCHRKNGQPFCCPIISDIIEGNFAVGCTVCRDAGSKCSFGQFKVNTPKYVQMISFRRHIESSKHIAVCERLGIEVIISAKGAQKLQLAANAPQSSLFLWGLTTTFTNSSYRSFQKFHQSSEVQLLMAHCPGPSVTSNGSDQQLVPFKEGDMQPDLQPEHVRTCKQVTCAMASVISSADRRIMARAMRMSMAVDDCDQTRVMTLKMVTANPIIQVHSCVASVLRDPGHGIDDAVEATMAGITQACHVRVGPLCKDTLEGHACYIDH